MDMCLFGGIAVSKISRNAYGYEQLVSSLSSRDIVFLHCIELPDVPIHYSISLYISNYINDNMYSLYLCENKS